MKVLFLFLSLFFAALPAISPAWAGPGAHGPNGEHLEASAGAAGAALPRIETFTEDFELVGQLRGDELSIMIDRYDSNEPVLSGSLEVQYRNLKATARFHADGGDYAVDDPALLAAISKPGAHPLLFTLVAGEQSDLLEGTLQVAQVPDGHGHGHGHPAWRPWLLAALAALALVGAVFILRRRRQRKGVPA
jgi:hypothetical protein